MAKSTNSVNTILFLTLPLLPLTTLFLYLYSLFLSLFFLVTLSSYLDLTFFFDSLCPSGTDFLCLRFHLRKDGLIDKKRRYVAGNERIRHRISREEGEVRKDSGNCFFLSSSYFDTSRSSLTFPITSRFGATDTGGACVRIV